MIFTAAGSAYGTAKSGTGIASMAVARPDLVMKVRNYFFYIEKARKTIVFCVKNWQSFGEVTIKIHFFYQNFLAFCTENKYFERKLEKCEKVRIFRQSSQSSWQVSSRSTVWSSRLSFRERFSRAAPNIPSTPDSHSLLEVTNIDFLKKSR